MQRGPNGIAHAHETTTMADATQAPHILVLDDTPEVLAQFRQILSSGGYEVTTGEKLYETIDDLVVTGPELLILDFMWSGDRTGWDYLEELRNDPRTRELPVILCTAPGPQLAALRHRFRPMNVTVVYKPFAPEELLAEVRSRLDLPVA